MSRSFFFSFLLACLLPLIFLSPPTTGQPIYQDCGTTGNYTANSTYESNLKLLLSSLASSLSGGFLNETVGQLPNQIRGVTMCRGDKSPSACRSCLNGAIQDAPRLCPYNRGATVIYDDCLLCYSDQRFFSTVENSLRVLMWNNTNNVTDRSLFDEVLNELMGSITDWAIYNTTRNFATGETINSTKAPLPVIYGLVQCGLDLSSSQCHQCLQSILEPRPIELEGKQGGRVITASCNYRYESYKFYDGPSALRLEPTPAPMAPPVINPGKEDGKGNQIVFAGTSELVAVA